MIFSYTFFSRTPEISSFSNLFPRFPGGIAVALCKQINRIAANKGNCLVLGEATCDHLDEQRGGHLERQRIIKTASTVVGRPAEPVAVALIGAGNRARSMYKAVLPQLKPWLRVTAVCDPVAEHARDLAEQLGARPYTNIRSLVQDRAMEAAIVVTPIDSHHSISVYLSSNGIHNLIETAYASSLKQARDMARFAERHRVVSRVAENFFRTPHDRFAQTAKASDYLGKIGRIFCYADHTGFHNNSRWIVLAGGGCRSVRCIEHTMDNRPFNYLPHRRRERETMSTRFFEFDDMTVVDIGGVGHGKGTLGRQPRPGHFELQGTRGTMISLTAGAVWASEQKCELRRCSDARFDGLDGKAEGPAWARPGIADEISSIQTDIVPGTHIRAWSQTPSGVIEHVTPFCSTVGAATGESPAVLTGVMGHVIDFVQAVCGMSPGEFSSADAVMSQAMEVAADESARQGGKQIVPADLGDTESDHQSLREQQDRFGVDPLDVEAMLSISFPRP
jgi:predicted dehydrogenase